MKKESSKSEATEIKLIDLMKVFTRRKWWFIGAFIIIFIAGILFTFLRTPQFSLTSTLVVSGITPDYYDSLMQLFPGKTMDLIRVSNITESEKFLSEDFLKEAASSLDFNMSVDELKDTLFVSASSGGILKLTTVYDDAEKTYEINKALFETYLDKRSYEINQAYEDLLDAIDLKMSSITAEIEELSGRSEEEGNLVDKEIELRYETYYDLEENKNILIENKDYFIERIGVSKEPDISDVYGYFNYKRDIVFSFFMAIAVGLITAFAANYFKSSKK
ncbi:hypothetical protein ES705_00938 [subsurface metagenome]|nr:hypothetical protein [Clostridia bacterium]